MGQTGQPRTSASKGKKNGVWANPNRNCGDGGQRRRRGQKFMWLQEKGRRCKKAGTEDFGDYPEVVSAKKRDTLQQRQLPKKKGTKTKKEKKKVQTTDLIT